MVSALVDLMVAVVCPLASVGDVGCVMVLAVPVAEIVTFFPPKALLLASFRVTVTVMAEMPSAMAEVEEAEIVDVLTDGSPGVKVIVTVLVRVMLSAVTVAEIILTSALVDLTLAMA